MKRRGLLTIDGLVNLGLGVLLILFPESLVRALGVPTAESAFYPNILGGVLFGIGVALLLERFRPAARGVGLGLGGAIAINLCGGLVLASWLVAGDLALPIRGRIFLWTLVVILVGLSSLELWSQLRATRRP